jgi:hypothetical protein
MALGKRLDHDIRALGRIDGELRLAPISESHPSTSLRLLKALRRVKPLQQIPDWIGHGQPIEVIRVQPPADKVAEIYVR